MITQFSFNFHERSWIGEESPQWSQTKDEDPEEVFADPNNTTDPGGQSLGSYLVLWYCVLHHALEHDVDTVLVTGGDNVRPNLIYFVPANISI